MRLLFLVVTALIVYGSLYPFNFVPWDPAEDGFSSLLDFSARSSGFSDQVQNVLLFLPVGLVGMQLLRGLGTPLRVLVLFMFAFNLSFGLQVAQLWVPGRVPSGADTVLNLIGWAMGVVVGLVPWVQRVGGTVQLDSRPPVPLLLALAWIAYQWAPFVPTLDIGLLRAQLKALVQSPGLSPVWTYQGVVVWLVIFHFLREAVPSRMRERYYAPLALFVVLVGLLISGNSGKVDRIAGAALALPAWYLLRRVHRPPLLAALMVLLLAAIQFTPLQLREQPGTFSWVPFSGAMDGNMMISVLATAKKLILYGTCIWLLHEAGMRLRIATLLMALFLFISEYLQIYLRGATPEATDALLALAMGFALRRYRGGGLASREPAAYAAPVAAAGVRAGPVAGRIRKRYVLAGALLLAGGVFAFLHVAGQPRVTMASWAGQPATFVLDPHTHTRFSDGALTPEELVTLAVEHGCNALAITDHSDRDAASPAQLLELNRLRGSFPGLVLLAGVELNIPSYGGREHLNVIVSPELEAAHLRRLADLAEDAIAGSSGARASDAAFARALAALPDRDSRVFTLYNHPSRKVQDLNESVRDVERWRGHGFAVDAVSGAPGHQRDADPGSYRGRHRPVDRWDPVVADVGGGWDRLLAAGRDSWGAVAVSDYHGASLDEPPCAFARTHVAAPTADYAGLLAGLKRGTFWADHGRILEEFLLSVQLEGVAQPVFPGAVVRLGDADPLGVYSLALRRGPGAAAKPLQAELISNCRTGQTEVLATIPLSAGEVGASGVLPVYETGTDGRSCYLRARVRLAMAGEPDLMAYSNPIRFIP